MPLASIGGTETVHTDVLEVLKSNYLNIYIRYRTNIWKGRGWAKTPEAKSEGKMMVDTWRNLGARVSFMSPYLEAIRLGRIVRYIYIRFLSYKINRSPNPVVIFWHRDSIRDVLPYIKPNIPIIDIVHNNSNSVKPDPDYLLVDMAPRINQRIVVSPFLKQMLHGLYEQMEYPRSFLERISIIPHKVHIPPAITPKQPLEVMQVLFAGRFAVEKRFHLFLRIVKQIAQSDQQKNFHFHIAGPEQKNFPEFANITGITWHGMVSDPLKMSQIYAQAHALVLTSSSEGFPKVIAEAGAYGVVPISTKVGGIGDFVINDQNGILIDSLNEEHIQQETVDALIHIRNNPTIFQTLSNSMYNSCKENFAAGSFKNNWLKTISNA